MELNWGEVDGVRTVWVDAPPPFTAGLIFRAGHIDETLTTTGRIHLFEHLSLTIAGANPNSDSGFVGPAVTGFITRGAPDEVASFLSDLCGAMGSFSEDVLKRERSILAAEAASRPPSAASNLLRWRYGAQGFGLIGHPEYGLDRITLDDLDALRRERFTVGNAMLWMSGPPPAGLRLDLPEGARVPCPSAGDPLRTAPYYFVDESCNGILAGTVVPRRAEATVFCQLAFTRLYEGLRTERSVSYAPQGGYVPLDGECAQLLLAADCDPVRRAELIDGFGEVLDGFANLEAAEIEAAKMEVREAAIGSKAPPADVVLVGEAQRYATDALLGRPLESLGEIQDRVAAVEHDALMAFATDVRAGLSFAIPHESDARVWMGDALAISTADPVEGRVVLTVSELSDDPLLLAGHDGVTMRWPDDFELTVRYADLAVGFRWDDGAVRLVARDAGGVIIEPNLWGNGSKVCDEVWQRVPEHLRIDGGERHPDLIPDPPATTAASRVAERRRRRYRTGAVIGLSLAMFGARIALRSDGSTTDSRPDESAPAVESPAPLFELDYGAIHTGMSYPEACAAIGSGGICVLDEEGTQRYVWPGPDGAITGEFEDGRLTSIDFGGSD